MTGRFSHPDPERCLYYASFMSHLDLPEANGIYWSLFIFVLFLLCVCANMHHRSIGLNGDLNNKRVQKKNRFLRKRLLGFVVILWLLSIGCAVLEVFALMNIQFCDGEDLIQLYWSFWGFLQTGSIIAIFGVILNLWIAIADVNTPSWAVALGTPVLVFAALHWILQDLWTRTWRSITGDTSERTSPPDDDEEEGSVEEEERRDSAFEKKEMSRWASRAPTIAPSQSLQLVGPVGTRRSSF